MNLGFKKSDAKLESCVGGIQQMLVHFSVLLQKYRADNIK